MSSRTDRKQARHIRQLQKQHHKDQRISIIISVRCTLQYQLCHFSYHIICNFDRQSGVHGFVVFLFLDGQSICCCPWLFGNGQRRARCWHSHFFRFVCEETYLTTARFIVATEPCAISTASTHPIPSENVTTVWVRTHTLWGAASIRTCYENRDSGLLEGSLRPVHRFALSMRIPSRIT